MLKKSIILTLMLLLCFSAALFAGCGKKDEAAEPGKEEAARDAGEDETPAPAGGTITMNGRSVMGDWMSYWGYNWEGPVSRNGYSLDYKELEADLSTIADSFANNIEGLPEGSVVFFKFCFADFYGDNLSQLEEIINEVVQTASEHNLKLIIGNALPMHKQDSPAELVTEYKEYNSYLEEVAASHDNVWVFDFYGVLAGEDGFLKPDFDIGDSHLNEEAYSALDPSFFLLLDGITK